MSSIGGFGPPVRIDGPPPIARDYTLLAAAAAAARGVRLVTDVDAQGIARWGGGAETWPFPVDKATVFDACAPASEFVQKPEGTKPTNETWAAFTVVLPVSCSTFGLDAQALKVRAQMALEAVESAALERELLAGALISTNPFLADGTGDFPNGNAATSVDNGLALLEQTIAKSGRGGIIHVSPEVVFTQSGGLRGGIAAEGGVLRTINGSLVVPGAGYSADYISGARVVPPGHGGPPTGSVEWIFASGAIDIRRAAEVMLVPGDIAEALNRATNAVTFRVERDYLVTWDNSIHAAVLVDRCKTTC